MKISAMTILKSNINTASEEFRNNADAMQQLNQDLEEKVGQIQLGGPLKAREKHEDRGKLLPRERVRQLLDVGSPFLEFSQFAAYGMYDGAAPAAGIITGIGRVMGQELSLIHI